MAATVKLTRTALIIAPATVAEESREELGVVWIGKQ